MAEAGDARPSEGCDLMSLASATVVTLRGVDGVLAEIGPGLPGGLALRRDPERSSSAVATYVDGCRVSQRGNICQGVTVDEKQISIEVRCETTLPITDTACLGRE